MSRSAPGPATFVDLLRWRAVSQANRLAFSFHPDDSCLTYAELDARARRAAAVLQARGSIGERALLAYPPGLDFVVALLGCLYAGWVAVPAPLPTPGQASRLVRMVRDAAPRVGLTTEAALRRLQPILAEEPGLDSLAWLTSDRETGTEDVWREPPLESDHLAIVQYTSGSTGSPRGVMLSHHNLLHNTHQIERRFEISADSRGVIWLPPFHDMGLIGGILQGVQSGFPISLMSPATFLRRPLRWLQLITRERATISGGPNFAYDLCVERISPDERASLDLTSWEVAFNGAEPVRATTLERFADVFAACGFRRTAFYPCYGLAEATLMATGGVKSAAPTMVARAGTELVSSGRVIDDHELLVVDPTTHLVCPPGQIGEIWLRGPGVAAGYWEQPDLTRQTFGAHLAGTREGPFLRSGDLGLLEAGELFVTGRLKAVMILAGRNVHAEDVEHTVASSHAGGWPGGVAAVSVEASGRERLVVLQEVTARAAAELGAIISAIRLAIAEQHDLPVEAVVLVRRGELPRTSSGKVRRDACRERFEAGVFEALLEWRIGASR
jgi:acyl-CoA synthetase (AMP-forming)/AMP-acid ligase II